MMGSSSSSRRRRRKGRDRSMRSLRKKRTDARKPTIEKTEFGPIAKSPKKTIENDIAKNGEGDKNAEKAKPEENEEMKLAKDRIAAIRLRRNKKNTVENLPEEKDKQDPPKPEKPPEKEKEKPATEAPAAPQAPPAAESKEPPKEEEKVQVTVKLKPSQSAPNIAIQNVTEKPNGQAVTQKNAMAQPQEKLPAQQAVGGAEAPKEEKAAPKEENAAPKEESAVPKEENVVLKKENVVPKEENVPKEEKSQRSFRISLRLRRRKQQQQPTKEEKSVRTTSIRERVKRRLKSAFSVFSKESIEKSFQTAKNKMSATIRTATYAYQDTYFGLGSDLDDDMEEDEDDVFLRDMNHRPDLILVEGNNDNDGELFNEKGVPFWKNKKYIDEIPKRTRKPMSTLLLSLAEKKLTLKESVPQPTNIDAYELEVEEMKSRDAKHCTDDLLLSNTMRSLIGTLDDLDKYANNKPVEIRQLPVIEPKKSKAYSRHYPEINEEMDFVYSGLGVCKEKKTKSRSSSDSSNSASSSSKTERSIRTRVKKKLIEEKSERSIRRKKAKKTTIE